LLLLAAHAAVLKSELVESAVVESAGPVEVPAFATQTAGAAALPGLAVGVKFAPGRTQLWGA